MLSYLKCLFCFTAITLVIGIDPKYSDLKIVEQYFTSQAVNVQTEQVKLRLYYECLCGGCIKLHLRLDEIYKKLESYIDLLTYPYGNAQKYEQNGTTVIYCQHGPEECYGNKLHACAIDILKNVSRSEFYNSCMMSRQWGGNGSTDMDATKCGESMNIDSKPIIDCAKGKRGEDLLEYYGNETDKVYRDYVPWLLINGKLFNYGSDDLKEKICAAIASPPPECKN